MPVVEGKAVGMAFTGETMITRPLRPIRDPRLLAVRELLHGADVRFTNAEMLFHNYEHGPGYLYGMCMRCDPRLIEDVQWLGINLISCANNHQLDFGEGGLAENGRNLDRANLVHAGAGQNYAEALAPAYLDSSCGRVALICATTSGHPHNRAGEQRRDIRGRPGVNLIRWLTEWTVDERVFSALREASQRFGWSQQLPAWWSRAYGTDGGHHDAGNESEMVYVCDRNSLGVNTEDPAARFVLGNEFVARTRLHRDDLERNRESVRDAARMADWVVFSVHNHESGPSVDEPPEHIRALAHAVVDAGADVVVGHGPHRDRGIEIYKGKPILYSLGCLIVQHDTMPVQPQDSMALGGFGHSDSAADLSDFYFDRAREQTGPSPEWWSVIAMLRFDSKRLIELELHPIELGRPYSRSGYPRLASGELAEQILAHIQRLSKPFDTAIEIRGEVALLQLS
jgi:poly-gamma-glutamate synthesis protein (capsule biosynthesis protein)